MPRAKKEVVQIIDGEEEVEVAGESKADKFKRLGKKRVNAALDKVRLVGNLSGSGYEYTTQEVLAIESVLQKTVVETMAKFDKSGTAKEKPVFDF